ncbi:MAG: hypothetical protein ACXWCG_03200 [Flavitalea sp.]
MGVTAATSQVKLPCNEIPGDLGFTVQSVRVMGRWVPDALQSRVEQLVGLGQAFDPPRISPALELVRDELVKSENDFAIRLIGSTSVLYIDSEVCDVSDSIHPKQVRVLIRAYYLRIDLYNTGKNTLPIPRSAKPTFFSEVPALLLAAAPVLSFTNDRQYGPALSLQTNNNILQFPGIKKETTSKPIRLNFNVDLRKSLVHPFHSVGINLDFTRPVYHDSMIGWDLGIRYEDSHQPLGNGISRIELLRIFGAIQKNLKAGMLKKYAFGVGARFAENNYSLVDTSEFQVPETGYEFFGLAEGRILHGTARLGVWFDAGVPKKNVALNAYQRVSGRLAYATVLGSGHKNLDVEAMIGGGYTWGLPPEYNQFFAGSTASNFLYAPFLNNQNRVQPEGAIVRSIGEREGTLRGSGVVMTGGSTFWHLNLNFTIPVTRWARPLIPDVVISEEPRRMTLRSALKGQVVSAKNFILDDLISTNGLPDDENTEAIADRIVDRDIRPTLDYLANRANVYSVKPLLLFDIGRLGNRDTNNITWLSAGLGVQVKIVVARLDLAYMHTLSPSDYSGTGNLFVRFILENFY